MIFLLFRKLSVKTINDHLFTHFDNITHKVRKNKILSVYFLLNSGQKPHPACSIGKTELKNSPPALGRYYAEIDSVFTAYTLNYHCSDTIACGFGSFERNKHFTEVIRGHSPAGIRKLQYPEFAVAVTVYFQYSAISESLLNILISYILRLSDDTKITENTNTCNQIKDYLDKNYTSNKSIDDICRDLYINKYYLTHLFKDAMGVPPLKYMITKRISLAKELLTTTDLTIEEVAIKCGYSDTTYFIKVFKKAEGITPIEFKNQQIEN